MSQDAEDLRVAYERGREHIKTLIDQIRVHIHLAGMDASEAFQKLSVEAEALGARASRAAMDDVIRRLSSLRASLDEQPARTAAADQPDPAEKRVDDLC